MSDNKKYYYMRLKEDFFDSEEMIILESMPDGVLYQNILLKMYCRSLKNEGRLMLNGVIPYSPQMLASVCRQQVGTVEKALQILQQLGLIEILDNGAIYMLDIQNYIGSSSTEADRQREYYNNIKAEKDKCKNSCKISCKISTPEIENRDRDRVIDRDIDNAQAREADPVPYKKIMELYNSICKSFASIRGIEGERKKAVAARYKANPDLETFKRLFTIAEESKFLQGQNDKKWKADFDFMMNPSRFDKILEGRYSESEQSKQQAQKAPSYDIQDIENKAYDKYRNAK